MNERQKIEMNDGKEGMKLPTWICINNMQIGKGKAGRRRENALQLE